MVTAGGSLQPGVVWPERERGVGKFYQSHLNGSQANRSGSEAIRALHSRPIQEDLWLQMSAR